jgi:soluble lytic murein transglycosylase-like protein
MYKGSPEIEQAIIILQKVPVIYRTIIKYASDTYQVPLNILIGLLREESHFNPNTTNINKNGTIDKGIAQLNSDYQSDFEWFDNNQKAFDPYDADTSIMVAASYLRRLYKCFRSWDLAVAAYNCGPGKVSDGLIPQRTKDYVTRIIYQKN